MVFLSIIFPIKNEAGNLKELFERTISVMEKMQLEKEGYEIICIDDHSTDNSLNIVDMFSQKAVFKSYRFDTDVGHAKAIQKGIELSTNSRYTLLMDADLQYNPEEIPQFINQIKNNSTLHIVNGWRKVKKDEYLKKMASKIYNYLCRRMFDTHLHDHASNFTLFLTSELHGLKLENNDQRYLIAIVKLKHNLNSSQLCEIEVSHNPRSYGRSKYPLWKKLFFGGFEIMLKKKKMRNINAV